MLIITTSAKTLDFASEYSTIINTQPVFLEEATQLVGVLKKYSQRELAKVLEVSEELAAVNYARFQAWKSIHECDDTTRPAIIAYDGDIYQEIHEREYNEAQTNYMQDTLRIISGLYGLVRPYDLIHPYRLEMKARFPVDGAINLYEFWGGKLTKFLNKEIANKGHEYIINLASGEYAKAIQPNKLNCPLITIEFNQQKGNKIANIGLLSKKARGMMIDFMMKNQVHDIKQLNVFDYSGYKLASKTDRKFTFVKEI